MVTNTLGTQTQEDILRAGYEALERELGLVGMIRFIQQISPGKGDYTAERQQPDDLTLEEVHRLAAESRAEVGDVSKT